MQSFFAQELVREQQVFAQAGAYSQSFPLLVLKAPAGGPSMPSRSCQGFSATVGGRNFCSTDCDELGLTLLLEGQDTIEMPLGRGWTAMVELTWSRGLRAARGDDDTCRLLGSVQWSGSVSEDGGEADL